MVHCLDAPPTARLDIQRDVFDSYEEAVGKDRPTADSEAAAKKDYADEKERLEGTGRDIKKEIGGALGEMLDGVLPTGATPFDATTFPWQAKVDLLFDNVVAFANATWDYDAGGAGRIPIFLSAKGNCGALATAFHQAVTVLALELGVPTLKCELRSHPSYLLTPYIAGTMTGRNGPYGNIARRIDRDTDPFDADYAGVRRAHFNGHTWAEVTFPTGGQRVYDLLMNTKGAPVNPTLPNGYSFVKAHDTDGSDLPHPPGFSAGKYMVADAVYDRAQEVKREYDLFIQVVKPKELAGLPALIKADLNRTWAARKLAPDKGLKNGCRAVQRIQLLSSGSIELAARLGQVWPATMRTLDAALAISAEDLKKVVS